MKVGPSLQDLCCIVIAKDIKNNMGKNILANNFNILPQLRKSLPEKDYIKIRNLAKNNVYLVVANSNLEFIYNIYPYFSLKEKLIRVLDEADSKFKTIFRSIWVDDLKMNAKYPDAGGWWEKADRNKTLSDYGFEPGETVTIFLTREE